MSQSDIICGIYESIFNRIKELAEKTKLFSINQETNCYASLIINDICQCMNDKSGQRIIVDEKQYEQPACYQLGFSICVGGKDIKNVLKAFGIIAVEFKDNPAIDISDWNWHGNSSNKVYMEPLIRTINTCRINEQTKDICSFYLQYKIEFSLNSLKGFEFKRVEQRILHSNTKNKVQI